MSAVIPGIASFTHDVTFAVVPGVTTDPMLRLQRHHATSQHPRTGIPESALAITLPFAHRSEQGH